MIDSLAPMGERTIVIEGYALTDEAARLVAERLQDRAFVGTATRILPGAQVAIDERRDAELVAIQAELQRLQGRLAETSEAGVQHGGGAGDVRGKQGGGRHDKMTEGVRLLPSSRREV